MPIIDYITKDFTLDQKQLELIGILENIKLSSALEKRQNKLLSFLSEKVTYRGFYLVGCFGSGKTMIMQAFCDSLKISFKLIHYQEFMMFLHQELHQLKGNSSKEISKKLAKKYSSNCKVLCIDEFEIKDITDAMLIEQLFFQLNNQGVFIFVTSNTMPDDLYKDGIQRASMLPFIAYVKEQFKIFILDHNIDYRQINSKNIISGERIIYPVNNATRSYMAKVIEKLGLNDHLTLTELELFGRKISFTKTYKNILLTDFNELCATNYSYSDYVKICQHFKIIVLENVPIIDEMNSDLALRFINFIDNAYFYKILLFASLADKPEKIYVKGKLAYEFKRTISRLYEMNKNS